MSECQGCEVTDRSAVAVFVCAACPHGKGLVKCTLSGSPIVEQVCGGVLKAKAGFACPIGKGPDEAGIVRWMGIRWRGVPWPVAAMLADDVMCGWFGHARPALRSDMPGCGCVEVLKRWTERAAARLGWTERDEWVGDAGMV